MLYGLQVKRQAVGQAKKLGGVIIGLCGGAAGFLLIFCASATGPGFFVIALSAVFGKIGFNRGVVQQKSVSECSELLGKLTKYAGENNDVRALFTKAQATEAWIDANLEAADFNDVVEDDATKNEKQIRNMVHKNFPKKIADMIQNVDELLELLKTLEL